MILSNEDVKNSKPHPEIYWKAISEIGVLPEETLIVEDSPYGLLAASRSNSHILRVNTPKDVTFENINKKINEIKQEYRMSSPQWTNDKLNIIIPMAGAGSRFEQAGYTFPKPLIDVEGKPMIQVVVENLNMVANFIFIVQKSHRIKYNLDTLLNIIAPNCKIIEVDGLTEGAACTALLAKDLIASSVPLPKIPSAPRPSFAWSFFTFPNEQTALDEIYELAIVHKPILFEKFQEMDNVPIEVREQYFL